MGDGFPLIDIVLFAMVAAFLFLRLRSVLGRRTGQERQRPNPFVQRAPEQRPDQPPSALKPTGVRSRWSGAGAAGGGAGVQAATSSTTPSDARRRLNSACGSR